MADRSPTPPRFSEKLIDWLVREELTEEILGNLYEFYHYQEKRKFSGLFYWFQVATYLRPSTLKRIPSISNFGYMFNFNLRIAFRNLWKNRTHSFLNLAGFTLGLACFMLLFFHIRSELSHDNFHSNGDEIYRLIRTSQIDGDPYKIGVTSAPYATAMPVDFPNRVTDALRVAQRDPVLRHEDKAFKEEHLAYADSNFFEFFDFPLLQGDRKTALKEPNSIVITEKLARKYFGEKDPMGKLLEVNNGRSVQVTGILGEAPEKSHLELEAIISFGFLGQGRFLTEWWWNSMATYIKVPNPDHAEELKAMFPDFMDKYFGDDFEQNGNKIGLTIEPLSEIYFNHETRYDSARHGNKSNIYILIAVAFAILLIAAFNYLNLSIATTYGRAREVGIRKVMGSNRNRLIMQFLGEAIILISASFILAMAISSFVLPFFNQYFQLEVPMNWNDPLIWAFFGGLIAIMVLLSGFYPALLFSSFRPVETLKGKMFKFGRSMWMRKGLVVAQFVIAIFMTISTLLITEQMNYVNEKDLGFDREAVIMVEPDNGEIWENLQLFKDKLTSSPHIETVTGTTGEPGGFHDATNIEVDHIVAEEKPLVRTVFTDYEYVPTFGVELVAGRNFSREFGTDMNRTALLNEKAVQDLGWTPEEAIGKELFLNMFDTLNRTVIGVVADYHFISLKDDIEPLIIALSNQTWKLGIKVKKGHIEEGLTTIESTWQEIAPGNPFNYEFLDENLARLYAQEQTQQKVYTSFSIIAIFLACLGVFGLISHSTLERKKEFNIRKVLGARIDQILMLIYREFVLLISIASLIAIPAAWWFIDDWLTGFAYRIETFSYWYLFLLGCVLTLVIAVLTMSFRALRAATGDPAEGLRSE